MQPAPAPAPQCPRVVRFDTKDAAREWYGAATAARPHVFGLLTTWSEVETKLLTAIATLGPPKQGPPPAVSAPTTPPTTPSMLEHVPVYALLSTNPDAALNTLRYLFFHTRCGVWVSIRGGVVALFMPFANVHFTNTYGGRICLTDRRLTVAEYAAYKARELHRRPERLLPNPSSWWLNGGIVCNVMPEHVWGEEYLFAIKDMLDETCATHAVPDCDFFVNKRDYPQLRRESGLEPYEAFLGTPRLGREVYNTYAPVFSFYTGEDMADVAMPTTDDWCVAVQACVPPGSTDFFRTKAGGDDDTTTTTTSTADADTREAKAVFRGTATGRGVTSATNARLRLAEFGAARPDLVDAGITGYNVRDRVVATTAGGDIVVDFVRPEDPLLPRRVPFMPMADQVASFKYVLYVDGHCAASRYGTLMHTGCVILRVQSEHRATSGHLWLFPTLVAACVGPDGALEDADAVESADHFLVSPTLDNLEATILYLRAHEAAGAQVATNAQRRAPTAHTITSYWDAVLTDLSRRQCACQNVGGSDGDVATPFDAFDPNKQPMMFTSTYDGFTYKHNDSSFHTSIQAGNSEPYPVDLAIVAKYHRRFPDRTRGYLDVGAHIGTTLLPYSRLFQHCVGFEPNTVNYGFLVDNVATNGVGGKCVVKNVGCSNRASAGNTVRHSNNSGCYFFAEAADGQESVCRLDDDPDVAALVVDFIKIDVEGRELAVLEGARETILRCKPLIAAETNGLAERLFGQAPGRLDEFMFSLGAEQFDKCEASTYYYFPVPA